MNYSEADLNVLRKEKKSVAFVGFASTSRELTPWDDPNIKIFGLNRAHQQTWMKRWDEWFQLHSIDYLKKCMGQSDGDRDHYDWMTQKHDFPLHCMEVYPEFPASVRYPIEEVRKRYGNFFTSTFAYMMALAMMQGYKHIEAYGFEMLAGTEYFYQRDSAEYFLGLAQDWHIGHPDEEPFTIYLPEKCNFLKGKLYAFSNVDVGLRQQYEFRRAALDKQFVNERTKYNQILGYYYQMEDLAKTYPDLQPLADKKQEELQKQNDVMQSINGAVLENAESLKIWADYYEVGQG
jgi:hypothetical protein